MAEQQTEYSRKRLGELSDIIRTHGAGTLTAEQTMEFVSLLVSSPSDFEKLKKFCSEQGGLSLLASACSSPDSGMARFVRVHLEEKLGISQMLALMLTSLPQMARVMEGMNDSSEAEVDSADRFSSFAEKNRWNYDPDAVPDISDNKNNADTDSNTQRSDLQKMIGSRFRGSTSERILIVTFKADHTLTSCSFVQNGSVDTVSVDVENIARITKEDGARYLILAHNHPSDNPIPSRVDLSSTRSLFISMKSIGVTLIDHFIITVTSCTSVRMLYNYFDTTLLGLSDASENLSKLEKAYHDKAKQ